MPTARLLLLVLFLGEPWWLSLRIHDSTQDGSSSSTRGRWALWKVAAALGYCVRDADPSLSVRNKSAKGRSEIWTEGEAVRLFKRAWRLRYYGLAAIIAVAWSTQLSPGDVRVLRADQLAKDASGSAFFAERGKTGVPVGGARK